MLAPTDPLPARPRRVLVAGTSGAGKTTLAAAIGRVLGLPHVEIDALFHGPDWTPLPDFEADVHAFTSGLDWVTEWQYDAVRALLLDRADLLVWLDLPRSRVMHQVTWRTVRRSLQRTHLWNGNVEPRLRTFLTDPEHIVRWAWNTHAKTERRVREAMLTRPELPVVRIRSRGDARRWLVGPLREAADRPR